MTKWKWQRKTPRPEKQYRAPEMRFDTVFKQGTVAFYDAMVALVTNRRAVDTRPEGTAPRRHSGNHTPHVRPYVKRRLRGAFD